MMESQVISSFPYYPSIKSKNFYWKLYKKKEFHDLIEETFEKNQIYFSHQQIVARFLAEWTQYRSLCLFHDTGTGKSASASAIFDTLYKTNPLLKTVYLSNSSIINKNFKDELKQRSQVIQKYMEEKRKKGQDIGNLWMHFNIIFSTYRKFAFAFENKKVTIQQKYNNTLFILDEAHHLVVQDMDEKTDKIYSRLASFFKLITNKKIVIMTATPMRNSPSEISPLINLLIEKEEDKLPEKKKFDRYFFSEREGSIIPSLPLYQWSSEKKEKEFAKKIQGYISVVKQNTTIPVSFRGAIYEPMKYFKIFLRQMSSFQTKYYFEALMKELSQSQEDNAIFSQSTQACLFVYPNGTYGIENTRNYWQGNSLTTEFFKETGLRKPNLTEQEKLERIQNYSCTYYWVIQNILRNSQDLFYVYCDKINGSGIFMCITLLRKCFGFSLLRLEKEVRETTTDQWYQNHRPAKRCIFLSETEEDTVSANIERLIQVFNDPRNREGKYIQVLFGTDKTKEGITLKGIQQVHIVSTDWNFGKMYQAIGRAVRIKSHEGMPQGTRVNIFLHASVPGTDADTMNNTVNLFEMKSSLPILHNEENIEEQEEEEGTTILSINDKEEEDDDDEPSSSSSPKKRRKNKKDDEDSKMMGSDEEEDEENQNQQNENDDDEWLWLALAQLDEMEKQLDKRQRISFSQLQKSLDFYKLYRCEIKDQNIKLIGYSCLIHAVDCEWNKKRNHIYDRTEDGGIACMYRDCKYTCSGIPSNAADILSRQDIDTSTYNMFYLEDRLPQIQEMVSVFLQKMSCFLLHDIVNQGKQTGFLEQEIIYALQYMIEKPVFFADRFGQFSFRLQYHSPLFYLSSSFLPSTWKEGNSFSFTSSYYASRLPFLSIGTSFSSLDPFSFPQHFGSFFSSFLQTCKKNPTKASSFFQQQFSTLFQEVIISFVCSKIIESSVDAAFFLLTSFLQEYLFSFSLRIINDSPQKRITFQWNSKPYLFIDNQLSILNVPLSTSASPARTSMGMKKPLERHGDDNNTPPSSPKKVISGSPLEPPLGLAGEEDHNSFAFRARFIDNNPYQLFGFPSEDDSGFKIVDLKDPKEGRKKKRGHSCSTMKLTKIIYFLFRFREKLPSRPPTTKKTTKNIDALLEEYFSFFGPITDNDDKNNTRNFFFIYYLDTRKQLCDLLLTIIKQEGLLAPKPIS